MLKKYLPLAVVVVVVVAVIFRVQAAKKIVIGG